MGGFDMELFRCLSLTFDFFYDKRYNILLHREAWQQWLDRGLDIKYIKFRLPQEGKLQEPDVEIELDPYRSYNRSKRSGLSTSK